MDERRSEPRIKSLLTGQVLMRDRTSTRECLVRNVSPGGALVFAENFWLPADFDLRIRHRDATLAATVAWRRAGRAGLALAPLAASRTKPARLTLRQQRLAALKAAEAAASY